MRNVTKFVAYCTLSMVVSTGLFAQGPQQGAAGRAARGQTMQRMAAPGVGMMGMGPAYGLASPQMVEELKLTDDQAAKIRELIQSSREEMQSVERPNLQEMTREQLQEWRAKREAEAQKQTAALEAKVLPLLNDEQKARFNQIALQMKGTPEVLTDSKVTSELKLTAQQKSDIAKLIKENQETQQVVRPQVGAGPEVRQQAMQQLRESRENFEASLLGVLTDEQKAKLDELKGAPIQMMRRPVMRGQGGDVPAQGGLRRAAPRGNAQPGTPRGNARPGTPRGNAQPGTPRGGGAGTGR